MDAVDAFLNSYGVAAACTIMLVKAIGVPIPVPGDVILLATAARAAEGKVVLWLAFLALLVAIILGSILQYLLARGAGRRFVLRFGARLGLTEERLEGVGRRMRQGGPLAIGIGVLTPGVRTAGIPACGVTNVPLGVFVIGVGVGSAADLALHFAIGFAGGSLLGLLAGPTLMVIVVVVLALLGLGAWLYLARRRGATARAGLTAWTQATCPVCVGLGAVRWEGAA